MTWIYLLLSLAAVVVGAEVLVDGSVAIARKFKIADFIIGATIVGIGTSCPELVVSLVGAIDNNADIAIGNVVGSNICNILLILGISALITPLPILKENVKFELPYCIGVSLLLCLLVYDFFTATCPMLGRLDGLILLAVFAVYMYLSLRNGKKGTTSGTEQPDKAPVKEVHRKTIWIVLEILFGLAILITGSHFFVDEAVVVARQLGVSDAFISITVLAVGTSLPELAASVASAVKKNAQLALGNIIGSNIFNISFILGVCSQVTPLTAGGIGIFDYGTMMVAALMPLLFALKGRISRFGGIFMLAMYVAYLIYLK